MIRSIIHNCFEMPYPNTSVEGINPLRGYSKLRLLFALFVYRARVGVSTYLVRVLGRRSVARASAKVLAAFIIVPVVVFWDMLLASSLTYNSAILVLGPPQALRVFDDLVEGNGRALTFRCRAAIFRVLSCAIVQRGEVHPVLYVLYRHCKTRLGTIIDAQYSQDLDNVDLLIHQTLPCLPRLDQLLVLRVLALTLVVDGSISYKERNYMMTALEACGCAPVIDQLTLTTRAYARGKLTYDHYRNMFTDLHGSRYPAEMSQEGKRMLWMWQVRNKVRETMMAVWTLI